MRSPEITTDRAARREERAARYLAAAGVPPRFLEARLTDFPPELRGPVAEALDPSPRPLVVIGPAGCGKTRLFCGFLRETVLRGYGVRFVPLSREMAGLSAQFSGPLPSGGEFARVRAAVAAWAAVPYLVLDDLQAGNALWSPALAGLVESRYGACLPTGVTANRETWDRLDGRLTRRLLEGAVLVRMGE